MIGKQFKPEITYAVSNHTVEIGSKPPASARRAKIESRVSALPQSEFYQGEVEVKRTEWLGNRPIGCGLGGY